MYLASYLLSNSMSAVEERLFILSHSSVSFSGSSDYLLGALGNVKAELINHDQPWRCFADLDLAS